MFCVKTKVFEFDFNINPHLFNSSISDGEGAEHYGVCSNYLANMVDNEKIYLFVRSASSFHMSKDPSRPVILIGPGTGIAPFRSFWQEWDTLKTELPDVKVFVLIFYVIFAKFTSNTDYSFQRFGSSSDAVRKRLTFTATKRKKWSRKGFWIEFSWHFPGRRMFPRFVAKINKFEG